MLDMSQMTVKYWGKSYSKLRESRHKLAWLSGGRNLERVEKLAPATQVREGAGESDGLRATAGLGGNPLGLGGQGRHWGRTHSAESCGRAGGAGERVSHSHITMRSETAARTTARSD